MASLIRRRRRPQFERAADGSMTLLEHLRELRSRLFKACLGILAGLGVGLFFATPVLDWINAPYCAFRPNESCSFAINSPVDPFLLQLKVALYIGLIISAPIWLYQLWAFIAPGLHRHERRYTYLFVAIAAPLFLGGAVLAHFVVAKSLEFFLGMSEQYNLTVGLAGYFDFVTGMMMLFGAGFEFPLIILMLNFAGVVSARRMLGWWRVAVFLMFLFAAIVTPTPDPFGMSALAGAMALLYFTAVGVAFLNDRRRGRRQKDLHGGVGDDEMSPIDEELDPVDAGTSIEAPSPIDAPSPVARPAPLHSRYDDTT